MKMRSLLVALSLAFGTAASAQAQVSVNIGFPGVNVGINMARYPEFVRIPGLPAYYAPSVQSNFFFYDGLFWVYRSDMWYSSSWYNGPWQSVEPEYVPVYVLRIPVRYYKQPPRYFRGWRADAPPRWGQYWGNDWERQRPEWNSKDRRAAPAPAPLPTYQRQYRGDAYPRAVEQQHAIRAENYRYQPRERVTQEQFQSRGNGESRRPDAPRPAPDRSGPPAGNAEPVEPRQPSPMQQRQAPPAERTDAPRRAPEPAGRADEPGRDSRGRGGDSHGKENNNEERGRGR